MDREDDSETILSQAAMRATNRQRSRASPPLTKGSNSYSNSNIDARVDGRQYTIEVKEEEDTNNSETIISAWINDENFSLKMYDIMNMQKGEGLPKITNETFTVAPDTTFIRCLYNPK